MSTKRFRWKPPFVPPSPEALADTVNSLTVTQECADRRVLALLKDHKEGLTFAQFRMKFSCGNVGDAGYMNAKDNREALERLVAADLVWTLRLVPHHWETACDHTTTLYFIPSDNARESNVGA